MGDFILTMGLMPLGTSCSIRNDPSCDTKTAGKYPGNTVLHSACLFETPFSQSGGPGKSAGHMSEQFDDHQILGKRGNMDQNAKARALALRS
nr:hypothetical protein [uncultured Desulfobacter sp.]